MTYYTLRRQWLAALGAPDPIRLRDLRYLHTQATEPITPALGWASYLLIHAADPDQHTPRLTVICAIEAELRQDLRHLDAAIYAFTRRVPQGIPHALRAHLPLDESEDAPTAAHRVTCLCDRYEALVHDLVLIYGLPQDPTEATRAAYARSNGQEAP